MLFEQYLEEGIRYNTKSFKFKKQFMGKKIAIKDFIKNLNKYIEGKKISAKEVDEFETELASWENKDIGASSVTFHADTEIIPIWK